MDAPAWGSDPWYVVDAGYGRLYVRDRGGLIAEPPRPYRYDGQDARFESDVARYKARVHLIKAAPDLAKACEAALEHMEWSTPQGKAAHDALQAALAKAMGW